MPLDLASVIASKASLGPVDFRSGVVTAVSGRTVSVNMSGRATLCTAALTYTAQVGDVALVAVSQNGRCWALDALARGTSPTPLPALPDTRPDTGASSFPPVSSATYRDDFRLVDDSQVMAGIVTTPSGNKTDIGVWFPGANPSARGLTGLNITGLSVTVTRLAPANSPSVDVTPYLHNAPEMGDERPSVVERATGGPLKAGVNRIELPASWGGRIVDGSAAGVAFTSADQHVITASRDQDAASGTLTFAWTRGA